MIFCALETDRLICQTWRDRERFEDFLTKNVIWRITAGNAQRFIDGNNGKNYKWETELRIELRNWEGGNVIYWCLLIHIVSRRFAEVCPRRPCIRIRGSRGSPGIVRSRRCLMLTDHVCVTSNRVPVSCRWKPNIFISHISKIKSIIHDWNLNA